MKKHLIAAAVAAAVAAPAAFAQSSVEVYGRLDAGYSNFEDKAADGTKTTNSGVSYSKFTNSRLGFKGTEDLGGGLKAGFVVEGNIGDASSTTGSSDTNNLNFGRQQYLTLSGGFGTVLAGKTDSIIKAVFDDFDAGYNNNLTGAADDFTSFRLADRDVTVRYTTPSFSGLTAQVGVINSTTKVDEEDSKTERGNGYELGLRYAGGPLAVGFAYRDIGNKSPSNLEDEIDRVDTERKGFGLGASYNLGVAVLFAQYFDQEQKDKIEDTKDDLKSMSVGVRVPVGASTLFASYTDGELKPGVAGGDKTDNKGYQLGVKYDLSKRTFAYFAYGDKEEKTAGDKVESKDYAFGLVHQF